MKILISNTSTRPLYEQIKDQLKDAILQGELAPGDALPSIRALPRSQGERADNPPRLR